MWGDLLDLVGQFLEAGGAGPGRGRSAGPPADVGTVAVLLGTAATVGGIVMLIASDLPHVASAAVVAAGLLAIAIGLRFAGRT